MKFNLTKYLSLGLLVVFISSCANIEITKRRYRPGYHIDVVKKKDRPVQNETEVAVEEPKTKDSDKEVAGIAQEQQKTKVELRKERKAAKQAAKQLEMEVEQVPEAFTADAGDDGEILKVRPFHNFDKQTREKGLTFQKSKFSNKLRKAIRPEGERYGWSVVSFIAFGLGLTALVMFVYTLATLVGILSTGGALTPVWIFGLVTLLLGIGGMITGIIGLRDTRDKRGRGFALTGMIGGILGLVFGLIFFLWGLIFDVILGEEI